LFGIDEARASLPRPSTDELLITGARFALEYLAGVRADMTGHNVLGSMRPAGDDALGEILSPERLLARGVRRVTKLVLFPVRFIYTADTGEVGTNEAAVARYLRDEQAPSKPLVAAALEWRTTAPRAEAAAAELLRKHMVPLYLHFIDDHIRRLDSLGETELVAALGAWRQRLVG
jgi:hypothetical protein